MMKKSILLMSLILSLLFLNGCETVSKKKQHNKLESTLKAYGKTVRWTEPIKSYNFLSPELSADTKIPDNLDNIRVVDYEIQRSAYKTDEMNAYQVVKITFIFKDRQTTKHVIDEQHWLYDKEVEDWVRSNSIPEFK